MADSITKERRISLVARFDELFGQLVPFARQDVDPADVDAATDEQRIAFIMGWYLQAIQVAGVSEVLPELVFKEVERRRTKLGSNVHPDVAAKFATRQTGGGRMSDGRCLISGDLEDDTLYLMWTRILHVHEWLEKAAELAAMGKEHRLLRYVPMANDQALIDLMLYYTVQAHEGDGLAPELGPEPVAMVDMLVEISREIRAESVEWHSEDGELDRDDINELNRWHPGEYEAFAAVGKLVAGYVPPLNSETEMYRRRNGIAADDAFWTDERICMAIYWERALGAAHE